MKYYRVVKQQPVNTSPKQNVIIIYPGVNVSEGTRFLKL